MVLLIKQKYRLYQKFKSDIWGIARVTSTEYTWLTDFFFKAWRLIRERNRLKKSAFVFSFKDTFLNKNKLSFLRQLFSRKTKNYFAVRVLKLFYLTLKYRQFRKFVVQAAKKDGLFESNYLYLLECRILSLAYRSNFFTTVFEAIEFIRKGFISVNGTSITYLNHLVKLGVLVTINPKLHEFIKASCLFRFRNRCLYFSIPRFLYVNYRVFFLYILNLPKIADLAFPVNLNVYRALGL